MIYYLFGVIFFTSLALYNVTKRTDYAAFSNEYIIDAMMMGVLFPYYGCSIIRTFWRITR